MDLSNIMYFGLFLDGQSRNNLMKYAKDRIPDDWNPKFFCDHMTIIYKTDFANNEELINWCEEHMNEEFYLAGLNIGISDKAMALRVGTKVPSANRIKHVTIATNMNAGGKPVDSNNIEQWKHSNTIILKGIVKPYYKK